MSAARSLPPVVRLDCRLLVLGSLPGAASLAAARYYAHPRNRFWQLMGAVLEKDLEARPYAARLETLQSAGVGLWDVVGTAHRPGSLDSAIRNAQANDLEQLMATLPRLRAIAFNGAKSHALGTGLLGHLPVPRIRLPSSSPANARMPHDAKLAAWISLRPFLSAAE